MRTRIQRSALPFVIGCGLAFHPLSIARADSLRKLTNIENAYPFPTADGRHIVFQSNRTGNWEIYAMNLQGGSVLPLTSHAAADVTPAVSPDGTRILFATDRDGNEEVYVMNRDGSSPRNLSRSKGSDSHPSWSPDGRRIVFCSTRDDGENDEIYVMNADGTESKRLTANGLVWDTFPSFSPDGSRILFRRALRARGPEGTTFNSEIFLMNADGTAPANISRDGAFDGWPAWSPDGKTIVFSSNRSDVYQIYAMSPDGSNVRRLVESAYTDVRPRFLPDGRNVIFNREREGTREIYLLRRAPE